MLEALMALSRERDPRRHLRRAVLLTRIIGGLSTFFGLFVPYAINWYANLPQMTVTTFLPYIAIWVLPGVLYILFSVFLQLRRAWAVVATMTVVSLQLFVTIVALVAASIDSDICGISFYALLAIALAYLLLQLSGSFAAIRLINLDIDVDRGFEPLPPRSHQTPPPSSANDNAPTPK